jgi:hypothetical protein
LKITYFDYIAHYSSKTMLNQYIWIALAIGVFFAGIGVSFTHFTNTYNPMPLKFQNQDLFDQMMSNNLEMSQHWMDSEMTNQKMMNDPQMRDQMMKMMMQNQGMMNHMMSNQDIMNMINDNMLMGNNIWVQEIWEE